jgi:hypothetical protein
MFIIYGSRHYGQIDTQGGQFQLTRFAHIYWLPLIPIGTLWVTGQVGDGYQGHTVGWSARSVLAGYARTWGPIIAVIAAVQGTLNGILTAVILAALTAWTWTWHARKGAREQRRGDVHAAAFGTRCDPLSMPRELAYSLRSDIDKRWAQASQGRTPEDLARMGTADPAQAALAYAALRLAARTSVGAAAKQLRALSEKLLDIAARPAVAPTFGGPYRAEAAAAPAPAPAANVVEGTRFEPPMAQ